MFHNVIFSDNWKMGESPTQDRCCVNLSGFSGMYPYIQPLRNWEGEKPRFRISVRIQL